MLKFIITVDGVKYKGIFACSCDAVIDAIERHPKARRVSVKAVKC